MKTLGRLILAAVMLTPVFSLASNEIRFRCTADSIAECVTRTNDELILQGCNVQPGSVSCYEADDAHFCSALSSNCDSATSDAFTGVSCYTGYARQILDPELSASWVQTAAWIWVRDICVPK